MYTWRENQYLSLVYTIYAKALDNTLSYICVSSYVVWKVHPMRVFCSIMSIGSILRIQRRHLVSILWVGLGISTVRTSCLCGVETLDYVDCDGKVYITLFRSNNVLRDWHYAMEYSPYYVWIWEIFCGIMSVPHNIVKDPNNVMYTWVLIDWYSFLGVLMSRNDDVSIEDLSRDEECLKNDGWRV
jgi:hypothetical protein